MTGLLTYQNNQAQPFVLVRDGIEGNYDVVWRMIDITRDTTILDKGFENFVKQLVSDNGFDAHSDTHELFSFLYNFIKNGDGELFDGVDYLQDIQGRVESIKDARTTLEDGFGDCDDHAILNASILAVLGYSPNFVIAKYPDSSVYQHVYTSVYVDGWRYVFDTTLENGKLNDEAEGLETQEIEVFGNYPQTDGLEAAIRNVKYVIKDTLNNAKQAAPMLSGFLPFGMVANKMISTLFGDAEYTEQSFNALGSTIISELTKTIIDLQNNRIPLSLAQKIARINYNRLFTDAKLEYVDEYAFEAVKRRIEQKVNYINNYNVSQSTTSVPTLAGNQKMLIGVGVVGLGLFYLYKQNNKK